MKEPKGTVDVGPKRLDFNRVSLSTPALNVVAITNGTNFQIEVKTLSIPSYGFGLATPVTLPLTIPAQTQALLTVEFLPTRLDSYSGVLEVLYQISTGGPPHKMGVALRGKGVHQ